MSAGSRDIHVAIPPRIKAMEGLNAYIMDNGLEPGDKLPGERELCEMIGVSRTALRDGLSALRSSSVLESRAGSGTYVAPRRPINIFQSTYNYSQAVREAGREPSSRVVVQEMAAADENVADRLEILVGEPYFHLRRVRLADDVPMIIEDSHIKASLCPGIERHNFASESLYEVLLEEYHVTVEHSMEHVTVGRMAEEEARLLQAKKGAPVIVLTGIEKTSDEEVVEYEHAVILPNRYRLANLTSMREGRRNG